MYYVTKTHLMSEMAHFEEQTIRPLNVQAPLYCRLTFIAELLW
jgi:hypothetical protein